MSKRTETQNGYFQKTIERNKNPFYQEPVIVKAKPAKFRYILLYLVTFGKKGKTYEISVNKESFPPPPNPINCRCAIHPLNDISKDLRKGLEMVKETLSS